MTPASNARCHRVVMSSQGGHSRSKKITTQPAAPIMWGVWIVAPSSATTATFLIEYLNVQNDANHVHSVWRDFDGDFGRDVLKEHLRKHPH